MSRKSAAARDWGENAEEVLKVVVRLAAFPLREIEERICFRKRARATQLHATSHKPANLASSFSFFYHSYAKLYYTLSVKTISQ